MKRIHFYFLLFLLWGCKSEGTYFTNSGSIYGTFYKITYESRGGKDLHEEIDRKLAEYNLLFSPFEKNSVISKINNNIDVTPDSVFLKCFDKAMEVSRITGGAFDITVAPLVNAWGFGFKNKQKISEQLIDSLLQLTGYEKIKFENGKFVKSNPGVMISMSAIAKGFTCDLMGEFLHAKGCENYMIDIGGEIVARGINAKGRTWRLGIREPQEQSILSEPKMRAVVNLRNMAMATSGNYLNYYIEDGKKYAHTIDPRTGYPVQYSLLSATVITGDCLTADAFATAFMVLGVDESIELSKNLPGIEVYFIYLNENGDSEVYMSEGMKQYID